MKVKRQNYGIKKLGTIGQQKNILIKDCPVLIPKENIKFFTKMSKSAGLNPFPGYGNSF